MLVQGWSIEETLRVTTSTDKLEVKVLPHVAESRVRVLVNNSAVGTESELSAPPSEAKQLPHEALMMVEVRQKEILVCTHTELGGAQRLSSLVCLGWERRIVPPEDVSANLHECTKGPSSLGW